MKMPVSNRRAVDLRSLGYRATPHRLVVQQVLEAAETHLTAREVKEAVERELLSLPPSSIYRTLDLFVAIGLVRRSDFAGVTFYEWRHRPGPHQPLVCATCNRVVHLENELLQQAVTQACEQMGFEGRWRNCGLPPCAKAARR